MGSFAILADCLRAYCRFLSLLLVFMFINEQHGNGTQEKFEQLPYAFFASSHQGFGFYPCSGYDDEEHKYSNVVNVMLKASSGSKQFRAAYTDKILPALREFKPDFILISAGFDAHCKYPVIAHYHCVLITCISALSSTQQLHEIS
jgi:Histone deacetylase domain